MDAPSPRSTTITRGQKASMFVGAALFGSWAMGIQTVVNFRAQSSGRFDWRFLFAGLCAVFFVIVLGAWLGGAVTNLPRSQPGKRLFWQLSGGALGGALALSAAEQLSWIASPMRWWLDRHFLAGCMILSGTLLGVLIGHAIGWGYRDALRD
jgi:hypothetical protein